MKGEIMRPFNYRFDENLWVTPGMEINYDQTEELKEEIHTIRQYYPELGHWGDLGLFMAWGSFSQDNEDLNWSPVTGREEKFLGYLYHLEQGRNISLWSEESAQQALNALHSL
jgi:hypothetical protein